MTDRKTESARHEHLFVWVGGRYACACGVWCYELPDPSTSPEKIHHCGEPGCTENHGEKEKD